MILLNHASSLFRGSFHVPYFILGNLKRINMRSETNSELIRHLNVIVNVLEKGFVRARSKIANYGVSHFDVGLRV